MAQTLEGMEGGARTVTGSRAPPPPGATKAITGTGDSVHLRTSKIGF